ncbi:SCO family protein [Amphiplicatus metriothermophilus]|uniref:Protein SCO1/2 n=1 Tax=Amphiplicatus metriothermophilus TaxID=1519374 RepID=A0A239PL93_9PROT|nr:SCO family protein [Amphiplicatus metriothermophilus]MBB5517812.1 protein SCO1/2 [Amphiplicatus metriothermophilus]SNT67854.1 protein SCO1/2 [Amphiplicatus metriothermophilus]
MRRRSGNPGGSLLIAALAALTLSACDRGAPETAIPEEAVIRLSDQFTSDFDLIDQHGRPVADEDFRGRTMVVYFGFATCPDVCPLALGLLSAALDELDENEREKIAPVFITVDPERDTPEALKAYLAFDERIIGLTGDAVAARKARESFKVYASKRPLPESALGYTMDHSSLFYVVDPQGRPRIAVHDTVNAEQLAAILRRQLS